MPTSRFYPDDKMRNKVASFFVKDNVIRGAAINVANRLLSRIGLARGREGLKDEAAAAAGRGTVAAQTNWAVAGQQGRDAAGQLSESMASRWRI